MDALQAFFAGLSPIVQLVTLVALCVIFWKPIAKSVFGYEGEDQLGALLSQMQTLTQHFNHETTEGQRQIIDSLREMNTLLHEFKEYGVKVRKNDVT